MSEKEEILREEAEDPAADGKEAGEKTESPEREKDRKERRNADIRHLKADLEAKSKALSEKEKALSDLNDTYLRLAAEYDNFRKRTQTERAGIYGDAVSNVLTGLLPIIDNLQFAAKYSGSDPEKLAEGLSMILGKLPETLDKLGIKQFGEPGDKFDPKLHNAILHIEDENYGDGEIVEVMQCGYSYGDRILRYAMVKVAN